MITKTENNRLSKTFIVFFGMAAYLTFLGSFLYALGFIGNMLVVKTIDSGEEKDLLTALLTDGSLLALFAIQHSVMARPAFKTWWTRFIPAAMERSVYVLLSSLALILICWKWQPIQTVIWKSENSAVTFVGYSFYFLGWLIVFLSTFMINHLELFGLKQAFDNWKNRTLEKQAAELKTNYFYTIVRHPIMLGFLIVLWATPVMSAGHLFFSTASTLYIFIAVKFLEEKDLRKVHGLEYINYQKRVPMIIPFLPKAGNQHK